MRHPENGVRCPAPANGDQELQRSTSGLLAQPLGGPTTPANIDFQAIARSVSIELIRVMSIDFAHALFDATKVLLPFT